MHLSTLHRTAHSLGLLSVGVLSTLGALSLAHIGPASAQSPGVNLAALVAKVNTLTAQVTALQGRVTSLETKTAPLSLSSDPNAGGANTLLTISAVNVQIVSGLGSTSEGTVDANGNSILGKSLSGLGNLIIGYNASGNLSGDMRTGSHNLVLGDQNSYKSFGGLIAGQNSTVSGYYASVSGGLSNTASGPYTSVSGGYSNTASGRAASVSGGGSLTEGSIFGWKAGSESTVGFTTTGNFSSP